LAKRGQAKRANQVAVISFVCSVGNIPLAAVLWNGGISFGGVIAFIFADYYHLLNVFLFGELRIKQLF
jgi:uncharacterized membrane protein YraQ (UPF0718 family)